MQSSDIRYKFDRAYNGSKNFLTPNIIKYGKRGRLLWELSCGEGMQGNAVFGVTVIEIDGTKRRDLSQMFDSRPEADAYISNDFVEKKEIAQ